MVDPAIPADVLALADERARARAQRDYRTADELKERIENAGWKVVDVGLAYELEPARPADVVTAEGTLYGSVASVPSRLEEPARGIASVVVVSDGSPSPSACLEGLAATAPVGTQVLVVSGPGMPVDGPADEVIGTSVPFSAGAALQAALRRAVGEIVVVLEPELVPTADVVTPFMEALADPSVAVVAADGLHSTDLHRYHPTRDAATTVAPGCYGFRRADVIARGPVDERLELRDGVAAWLGLLLRDEGPATDPRRALVLDLSLRAAGRASELPADHARLARRDGYRIADRFRHRRWLAGEEPPQRRVVGDGPDDGQGSDHADEGDHAEQA